MRKSKYSAHRAVFFHGLCPEKKWFTVHVDDDALLLKRLRGDA